MSEIRELSVHELETERADLLPGREALGWFRGLSFNTANIAASNSALALNAAAIGSTAIAGASQQIIVVQ